MRLNFSLLTLFIAVVWLSTSGWTCSDTSVSTQVETAQKISNTTGDFSGTLDDDDRFGSAVANIGDLDADGVTDLAVGSPRDDDGGTDRGAVWILFMNDDGTVDIEEKISDDDSFLLGVLDDNDQFGSAVAELGDLNRDGVLDIAVGAPFDDDAGTDRGAIWILFMNADGTIQFTQKITENLGGFFGELEDNDQFGGAIANIGDLNNDTVPDIAVGARLSDDGGADRGAVWVLFMSVNGTVIASQKISEISGDFDGTLADGDYFGSSVAGIGDLDADGVEDIATGAIGDDDGGIDRGAVWILFMNTDGSVRLEQKISENNGNFNGGLTDGNRFGSSLAGIGDLDDDGIVDIAAGADQDDDGGLNRGAVYILFMDNDGQILSKSKISSTSGNFSGPLTDGDQFGSALTDVGDLDRDGTADISIGANLDDDGGVDRGAVWTLFMQQVETEVENTFFDNRE